ncbi:MAG: hypothetical protein MZV70_18190 [Desulfobacterales bacterium]|nr:hypothetical protein [Desulfobacterales bacterium]
MKDEYVSIEHLLLGARRREGRRGRQDSVPGRASRGMPSSRRCRRSAAPSASPTPTRRKSTRPCSASAATSPTWPGWASSTRSSAGTRRSAG